MQNATLVGTLSDCICNLVNLKYMYLSANGLEGSVPVCISDMIFIAELHIDCNEFIG